MFNVGDKIVYPMHGAGTIDSIEEKDILGEKQSYYILKMPGEVKVMVPTLTAEEHGIRNVIDKTEAEKVKNIVKKAKESGKITYGELAKELENTNPEQIDKVFDAFEEMGVSLLNDDFEEEPDVEDLKEVEELKLDEITDMVSKIDLKTRNVDIDFVELKLAIICEGVKNPSFRDKEVMEHFGVSTPYDLVKLMLTSGERDALYNEIQELSGYNAEVIKEIKKQ